MSKIMRIPSVPVTDDVSELVDAMLTTAKIDLVRAFPFMGYLVMTTRFKYTLALETMAATTIPNNTIFVNPVFLEKVLKNRRERAFVLGHEILHIFLEHVGRGTENAYDPKLWNIATDLMINAQLISLKSNFLEMPEFGLYESRFHGWSADAIYHKLLEEAGGDPRKAVEQYGGDIADAEGESHDDEYTDGKGFGSPRPFDALSGEHVSEATKQENKQKVSAAIMDQGPASKNMGQGYADLVRLFEDMVTPVIPWVSLLSEFITETCRDRYTYNRISRRSTGSVIFPTLTGNSINVLFGVDTSGSMSQKDLTEAMTELKSIIDNFDSWSVTLISCDTQAHVIGEYHSEDGDDWTTIDKALIGGGGTELSSMIRYAEEMEEPPSVIVIITDGFIPTEPMDDAVGDVPTFVIVTKDGNAELKLQNSTVVQMNDY